MTKTARRGPSWSDVKESIASLGTSELIQLIASLYKLSKSNRDFLHARFSIGDDPISPYKKIIEECMFPDVFKNKPIQISTAKIGEGFYDALLRMYARGIKKVLSLADEGQHEFREILRTIMVTSDGIGWGYHDGLCDQYYEGFPENE